MTAATQRVPLAESVLLAPGVPGALDDEAVRMVRYFADIFVSGKRKEPRSRHGFTVAPAVAGGKEGSAPPWPPNWVPVCNVYVAYELRWEECLLPPSRGSRLSRGTYVLAEFVVRLFPAAEELHLCPPPALLDVLYRLLRAWPDGKKHVGRRGPAFLEVDPARLRPGTAAEDVVRRAIAFLLAGVPAEEAIHRAYDRSAPSRREVGNLLRGWSRALSRLIVRGPDETHVVGPLLLRLGPLQMPPDLSWLSADPCREPDLSVAAALRERRLIDGFQVGRCLRTPDLSRFGPMTVVEAPRQKAQWLYVADLVASDPRSCSLSAAPSGVTLRCRVPWYESNGRQEEALATVLRAWPDGEKVLAFEADPRRLPAFRQCGAICHIGVRLKDLPPKDVELAFRMAIRAATRSAGAPRLRQWIARLTAANVRALEVLADLG